MDENQLSLERRHLAGAIAIARAQWDEAARNAQRNAEDIEEIRREQQEQNAQDIGGLTSAQGFLDLMESSQSAMPLAQAQSALRENEQALRRLARTMDAPYFARIDFRFAEDGVTKPIYIGRSTLMDDDTLQIHVYDWRVPIASVFYQHGVGPAAYEAPAGIIHGDVLLKRQYEIRHGELLYFFDADEQVLDTFLRDLLSRPASTAMKGIVETIQRDQDQIIRDLRTDLLMVQGTAGSGKTSVALHRVAYLMYQGLKEHRLRPHDILIIAPNAAFERYISQVLPDLGEQQVRTRLFDELAADMLPGLRIQPRGVWAEAYLSASAPAEKARMAAMRRFKGSAAYVALLDRFVHDLPRHFIPFSDVEYAGARIASRHDLRTAICNPAKIAPLATRLRMLERAIWARAHALRPARHARLLAFAMASPLHATEAQAYARMLSIRECGVLDGHIRAFTRLSAPALYRALFADKAAFARLAHGLLAPEDIEPFRLATLDGLSAPEIPYSDAMALAYLDARIHGCRAYSHIRQLLVDEAQDLDVLHTTLLGLLFPHARFTLLGDVHQTLTGAAPPTLYADIQSVLRKKTSRLVTLDKSFRCTREIWAFSAQFLPPGEAGACFSRSGDAPQIHAAPDEAAMDALLTAQASACRAAGLKTIALVCKTAHEARALHARLRETADISLITDSAAGHGHGVFVIPLFLAKGLEFDAVLLCHTDAAHYAAEADKNLLYVGCTRALHQLHLFYTGERSPLLPPVAPDEKEDA